MMLRLCAAAGAAARSARTKNEQREVRMAMPWEWGLGDVGQYDRARAEFRPLAEKHAPSDPRATGRVIDRRKSSIESGILPLVRRSGNAARARSLLVREPGEEVPLQALGLGIRRGPRHAV